MHDIVLYPPLKSAELVAYQQYNNFDLPGALLELFEHFNGVGVFGLNIYGTPSSMAQNPPKLNRQVLSPLDIGSGRHWRFGYAPAEPEDTLFASKNVGENGQIGFFISPSGRISGRGNESEEVSSHYGPWVRLGEWLAYELEQTMGRLQ